MAPERASWWDRVAEQFAAAANAQTARRLIGAAAIVGIVAASVVTSLRQPQTRVVSRRATDVPLSGTLTTTVLTNGDGLSANVVSRLARQLNDVAYETRRLAGRPTGARRLGGGQAGGTAVGLLSSSGRFMQFARVAAPAAVVDRNALAASMLVRKIDGLLSRSVVGWWRFDGAAGQVVSVTATSDAFDTVVRLLSPDGEELGPGFGSRFLETLPADGRYRVRVTAGDGGTGSYAVAVRTVPVTPLALDARPPGNSARTARWGRTGRSTARRAKW